MAGNRIPVASHRNSTAPAARTGRDFLPSSDFNCLAFTFFGISRIFTSKVRFDKANARRTPSEVPQNSIEGRALVNLLPFHGVPEVRPMKPEQQIVAPPGQSWGDPGLPAFQGKALTAAGCLRSKSASRRPSGATLTETARTASFQEALWNTPDDEICLWPKIPVDGEG